MSLAQRSPTNMVTLRFADIEHNEQPTQLSTQRLEPSESLRPNSAQQTQHHHRHPPAPTFVLPIAHHQRQPNARIPLSLRPITIKDSPSCNPNSPGTAHQHQPPRRSRLDLQPFQMAIVNRKRLVESTMIV